MQLIFDHQKHTVSSPVRRTPTTTEWVVSLAFLMLVSAIVLVLSLNPTRSEIKADQTNRVLPKGAQIEINPGDPSGRQWSWSLQPRFAQD